MVAVMVVVVVVVVVLVGREQTLQDKRVMRRVELLCVGGRWQMRCRVTGTSTSHHR